MSFLSSSSSSSSSSSTTSSLSERRTSRYSHHHKLSLTTTGVVHSLLLETEASLVDSTSDCDSPSSSLSSSLSDALSISLSPTSPSSIVSSAASSEPSTPFHAEKETESEKVEVEEKEEGEHNASLTAVLQSVFTSFFPEPFNWSNAMSWAKPPVRNEDEPLRYCMVMDLDETLLHSFFPDKITGEQRAYLQSLVRAEEQAEAEGQLTRLQRTMYEVDVGDGTLVICVLRPHVHSFLSALFEKYDVGVWSAGGRTYVESICKVVFPQEFVSYKPVFEMCWEDVQVEPSNTGGITYTKPLTTITNRFSQLSLNHLILVDNRPENACYFPNQLVHVPDYYPDPFTSLEDHDSYLLSDAMNEIDAVVHKMELVNTQNSWMAKRVSVSVALAQHAAMAYQQQLENAQEQDEEQQEKQDPSQQEIETESTAFPMEAVASE